MRGVHCGASPGHAALKEAHMKVATRFSLIAIAIIAATSAMTMRAEAQDYPWCAQYSGDFGGTMNCGFVSFNQCMDTVRGMGGFCIENNTYQPPGGGASSARPKKHAAKS